jgi:hypothetical protein
MFDGQIAMFERYCKTELLLVKSAFLLVQNGSARIKKTNLYF